MTLADIAHWIQRETDVLLGYCPAEADGDQSAGDGPQAPAYLSWPPGDES